MRLRGKISLGIILLVLISAGIVAAPSFLSRFQKPVGTDIPTVRVTRGPLETKIFAVGELRPANVATVMAPPVGGTLQIIHIVGTGAYVKKDDVIVEFDPVEQEYNLEQNQSQLDEADQQIRKLQADIAVRKAQDEVSLLTAQFNVRRAELRIRENDLLGTIDARKNVIALEEAKRRYEQMQRDIKSKAAQDQADLATQNVNRTRAMMQMKMAQTNIDNMKLRAPIDGIVVLTQNFNVLVSGGGGVIISMADMPEYREGDTVNPGMTMAQIQDVEQMEIASKVAETDRGNVSPGQPVDVHVDSILNRNFTGKVKSIAGMASTNIQTTADLFASTRTFDAVFELDVEGMRFNPGVSARVEVRGTDVKDTLSLPRQALFSKEGKPVVYVRNSPEQWEARAVQIKYLTESRAAIEGIAAGTDVALVDPNLQKAKGGRKTGALGAIFGGAVR